MKGTISVNTKKGLGTEFIVNLPLTIIEKKAEEPSEAWRGKRLVVGGE